VLQQGAVYLTKVRRISIECGLAQLVVRRFSVQQARVQFSAEQSAPQRVFSTEPPSDEEMEEDELL
jgi:hypothetical protein